MKSFATHSTASPGRSVPAAPTEPPTSLSFISECDINSRICFSVHHSSDNRHIYIGCDPGFKIYDKKTKNLVACAADLKNTTVVESDCGIFLSSSDMEKKVNTIYNYNLISKRQVLLFSFPDKSNFITKIAVSPDYIAAIDRDNNAIKLYNRRSQAVSTVKAPGLDKLFQLRFSPDGRSLLVTGRDGKGIQKLNNYHLIAFEELIPIWSSDDCPEVIGMTFDDGGLLYANSLRDKAIYILNDKGLSVCCLFFSKWLK